MKWQQCLTLPLHPHSLWYETVAGVLCQEPPTACKRKKQMLSQI